MHVLAFGTFILRYGIALVLGGLIGWEREAAGKDAGVRTEMLVAGGASLLTMVALLLPNVMGIDTAKFPVNPDRIIANIVTGIGFLCGGIIFKSEEHTKGDPADAPKEQHTRGLTTAALIWVTATIGIIVGLGFIKHAVTVVLISLAMLYATSWLKKRKRTGQKQENGSGH